MQLAEAWVARDTANPAAWHAVALAALPLLRAQRAQYAAARAVAIEPREATHHVLLGRAYFDLASGGASATSEAQIRRARSEFDTALALDSLNLEAREYLFTFHLTAPTNTGAGRATARRLAAQMFKLDRVMGTWARLRAAATLGPDSALRHAVTQALDVAGTAADSNGLVMATLAASAGAATGASMREELVALVYRRFPEDPRVDFTRARVWVQERAHLSEAEGLLAAYVDRPALPPMSAPRSAALWWLGQLYERLGRTKDALGAYDRATLAVPPSPEADRDARRLRGHPR